MAESDLKIGVLSRRAPIGQNQVLEPVIEHVGGLTRVLPALAEFAHMDWYAFTTQSQLGLPKHYSFSKISNQDFQHKINIYLTKVDDRELDRSDWFCAHYIWPLLHDLTIPDFEAVDIDLHLESINRICQALASKSVDISNNGYLVNDFQLSQAPGALKNLGTQEVISFFLHTPWPKPKPSSDFALKILKFLATGMMAADIIEFQTQKDLQAFERFVLEHLPTEAIGIKLQVNPVSVNVQNLQGQLRTNSRTLDLDENDISYVHVARSDPIKNTLVTIRSFVTLAQNFRNFQPRKFLDLFIVPSRQQWPEYQELLTDIAECVESGNSKLSSLGYIPIRLHVGNDYSQASLALTRFDYLIVCSVADGLNLVVKEGAVLNNRNGVIVSTAEVGAMAELGNFCVIADDATESGVTKALVEAAKLTDEIRKNMAVELKNQIQEFDASYWAQSVAANFKILEKV